MSWLDRYRNGEREAVWAEMASRPRLEPHELAAARDVATETMKRGRACIEALVERLQRSGYVFLVPHEIHVPPDDDCAEQLDELERTAGPIPLGLRAFWEQIGSVNFQGSHPEWPLPAYYEMDDFPEPKSTHARDLLFSDPLVVASVELNLDEWKDCYRAEVRSGAIDPEEEPFRFVIAPDALTKANVSGGEQRIVAGTSVDPSLLGLYTGPATFVSYVRGALRDGGFAGLSFRPDLDERQRLRTWAAELTRGLDPI